MKRVINGFWPVLRGFLWGFVGLQIVLGVYYIGNHFMVVPQFRDTLIYLEMTEQFVMDEYTGLLYPVLVKVCYSLLGEFYFIPIYLLQIIAGLFCVYHFICTFTEKKILAAACSLWLNTIPFVAQVHVSILPHSLALCCMVLMLLEIVKGAVQRRPLMLGEWAVLLCSFTILCQLTRGYIWVGTLFLIWAAGLQFYKSTHKGIMCLITLLICAGIVVCNLAIYHGTERTGFYGRIQNTPQAIFFQRTAGPILSEKYMIYMPEEIETCFTGAELDMFGRYPYKVQNEMGPVLEARYGKERAAEIYVELGLLGLETATKDNLISFAEATISYAMPLMTYGTWRDGQVKGMTSWNYQQFTGQMPVLATAYSNICYKLWLIGLGLSVIILGAMAWKQRRLQVRIWLPALCFLGLFGALLALKGAGVYDYKLALLPMMLGYGPICILLLLNKDNR